jgi:hypothetical protein
MTRVLGSENAGMVARCDRHGDTVMRIGRMVQRTWSGSVQSSGTLEKRAWRVSEAQDLVRAPQRGLRLGRRVAHVLFPFLE